MRVSNSGNQTFALGRANVLVRDESSQKKTLRGPSVPLGSVRCPELPGSRAKYEALRETRHSVVQD